MKNIEVIRARQNNLKSIDVNIPLGSFTVVCGLSGSGKSSLAFETLFASGQRHYTETLSNYARQYIQELPRPLVKKINNIPPALALEQKNPVRSARPTVATVTELSDLLRLLFSYSGQAICPKHKAPLVAYSAGEGGKKILEKFANKKGLICVPIYLEKIGSKNLKKKLQGFRIAIKHQGRKRPEICSSLPKILTNKELFIVLDRMVFKNLDRLVDSLSSAYRIFLSLHKASVAGRATVFPLDKEHFILSEHPSCPVCSYHFPFPLSPALFNFNSSLGACPSCKGFGHHLILDENKVVPDPEKSLMEGALNPFTMPSAVAELRSLKQFCRRENIDLHTPWKKLLSPHRKKIWKGTSSFMGVEGFFNYLEGKKYKIHVRVFLSRYKSMAPCSSCGGGRFRKEVEQVKFQGKTLTEMLSMDINSLTDFFTSLPKTVKTQDLVQNILLVLNRLKSIGLEYLRLDRLAKTLSTGEFQRLNLVHQLGLGLSQVLYVLDEPTVGLHSKDSLRLMSLLEKLREEGNTLLVVEHDPEVIKKAQFVVELGPGAGQKGGQVVFAGKKKDFLKSPKSLTAPYLSPHFPKKGISVDPHRYKYFLEISGCEAHNLKNVHLKVPLHRLVTVTGVSGSGKSTLISETLYPALAQFFKQKTPKGHPYKTLKGTEHLRQVVLIDSSSVERTKRSLPVTYLKFYDSLRSLMATYCKRRGGQNLSPGLFSLNVEGGRCSVCQGLGYKEIEMVFMDAIRVPCEECKGKRFSKEVLNLTWRNKNIHQILSMTVEEGLNFFVSYPAIWKPLSLLKKVGLEYLVLGQSLSTLSGGESQRLKLAREFLNSGSKNTLYILDEPTRGLHFKEVKLLLALLRDLIKTGASVLLIEHNMDLISQSDWLIDMGPGAGPKGGEIVAQGTPHQIAKGRLGATAHCLKNQYIVSVGK